MFFFKNYYYHFELIFCHDIALQFKVNVKDVKKPFSDDDYHIRWLIGKTLLLFFSIVIHLIIFFILNTANLNNRPTK